MGAFETPSLSVIASQTLNLALLWFATPPGFTGWYCTGGVGVGGGLRDHGIRDPFRLPSFTKWLRGAFIRRDLAEGSGANAAC